MLSALDVIWIFDQYIDPRDWKMAVIIEPDCLFYFRINSKDRFGPCIPLEREPHHTFLRYDSFLECNLPQELTEFEVEQALRKQGVIGKINVSLGPQIYELVKANPAIGQDDKRAIGMALVGSKNL